MLLHGKTTGKTGDVIPEVLVEIKDSEFRTICSAKSDDLGYYEIDLPEGGFPFVTAVRDYGEKYLEYWCSDLKLIQDTELNICIDTLEIYGLNYFKVAGAHPSLMVYFRPMSLAKYFAHAEDLAPEISTIKVTADGKTLSILLVNVVREYIGDRNMSAYLIQVEEPVNHPNWSRLIVEITDANGNYGAASIYNKLSF